MDIKTIVAITAAVIAVISVIVNIYIFRKTTERETYKNKNAILYPNYEDILIQKLPSSFSKLTFTVKDDNGIDQFIKEIQILMENIKIIEIIDDSIYGKWSQKIMEIEDFVTNTANNIGKISSDQNQYYKKQLKISMQSLYEMILTERFQSSLTKKRNKKSKNKLQKIN